MREEYRDGRLRSARTLRRGIRVAPNNVGPKTMPDYDRVWRGAITELRGGAKVFAGPRDDPFFVDLGTTFDTINFRLGTGNAGGGKDDLAGYGVHSVVLQLPEALVTRNGRSVGAADASNAVVGVWASTERRRIEVRAGRRPRGSSTGYVQVSRLGNPLVNEVVIPIGRKDQFNRTTPDRDAALYGRYVVQPELARTFNALFPGVNAPERDRTDIVTALSLIHI